jgi:hypothetical protein
MVIKPEKTLVGNFPYFAGMFFTLLIGIAIFFLIKNKSQTFKKWFIFGLFLFNSLLHFFKIFNSYYQQRLPEYYATITFDNICAVSTVLFTITYLSKLKVLKDYMFYMGIISGIAALLYPSGGVLNRTPYAFDYFRFYTCHAIILFGPIYMVVFGFHKLDYRRIWKVPFVLWGVLTIIFINTILCAEIGITKIRSDNFLSPGYDRNASLVFGFTENFAKAAQVLLIFVPDFLKTVPFGEYAGEFKCVPLVWLFPPTYIYLTVLSFLMAIPFQHKKMKNDFSFVINSLKKKLGHKKVQEEKPVTVIEFPVKTDKEFENELNIK